MIKKICIGIVSFLCLAKPCTDPIFRYALQNWRPEPYRLIVFIDGSLSTRDSALIEYARETAQTGRVSVFDLYVVNFNDTLNGYLKDISKSLKAEALPYCYLTYPQSFSNSSTIWSGAFTKKSLGKIFFSPARKEISKRILEGHAGVWVLLEDTPPSKIDNSDKHNWFSSFIKTCASYLTPSGNKNQKAYRILLKALKQINASKKVTAPHKNTPEEREVTQDSVPVHFSVYRLSRHDPMEKLFVQMLLELDSNNITIAEPVAFPLFGRGRTMPPMKSEEITKENIQTVSDFLTIPCACVIKADNPGTDLLFTVSWKRITGKDMVLSIIEETPLKGFCDFLDDDIKRNVSAISETNIQDDRSSSFTADEKQGGNDQSLILFSGPSSDYSSTESKSDNYKVNIGSLFSKAEWSILILCNLILVGIMVVVGRVLVKKRNNSGKNNS